MYHPSPTLRREGGGGEVGLAVSGVAEAEEAKEGDQEEEGAGGKSTW